MFEAEIADRYSGYNPEFYRRVQAKRKKEQARQAQQAIQKSEQAFRRELRLAKQDSIIQLEKERDRAKLLLDDIRKINEELEEQFGREQALRAIAERVAKERDEFAPRYRHSFATIERRMCMVFGVSRADLRSKRRHRNLVLCRQAVMYWGSRLTPASSPAIGRMLGGLDHTTCLHAMRVYPQKRAAMGRYLRPVR